MGNVNRSIGRTARAGLKGKAYSFYTDRDEPIAEILTKTLLETQQEVPDFLKPYIPDGVDVKDLKFEAGSDEEDEGDGEDAGGAGSAGGWGGDSGAGTGAEDGDGAWGSGATVGGEDPWGTGNNTGGSSAW